MEKSHFVEKAKLVGQQADQSDGLGRKDLKIPIDPQSVFDIAAAEGVAQFESIVFEWLAHEGFNIALRDRSASAIGGELLPFVKEAGVVPLDSVFNLADGKVIDRDAAFGEKTGDVVMIILSSAIVLLPHSIERIDYRD